MKKFISLFLIIFMSICVIVSDAHAKRFGGGRNFGTYRSSSSFARSQPAATNFQRPGMSNANRWLGPLAGLAMGGLLASLFMGNGLASGLMSWLMVGGVILLVLNLLKGRSLARNNSNVYQMQREPTPTQATPQYGFQSSAMSSQPIGFNEADFIRQAKVQFIRLQAAYDQKNLQDIAQFTTPEVYAEVKMQLQERGDACNQTDVVSLDATLLEATQDGRSTLASIEFSGLIKEDANAEPHTFNEIWHFRKDSNTWLTAGIQQN